MLPVAVVVLVVEVEVALGVVVEVVVTTIGFGASCLVSTAQVMLLVTSPRFLVVAELLAEVVALGMIFPFKELIKELLC